jgi:glycine cleavage system transcriptional repressor
MNTMTTKLVISALGEDRPGIVDKLSSIIYDHALNIEDSRMTVLGGEFAILLLVSGEQSAINALQAQLSEIEQALQMNLLVKNTTESVPQDNTIPYSVEVAALDHPGIVRNIASFFSSRNINIVNLETERYSAPHTGSPMFALHMTIGIPAEINIPQLRDAFMDICDELNLDAELNNL